MKLTGENQLHGKFFEECVINTYIDGNYQGKILMLLILMLVSLPAIFLYLLK